MIVKEILLADRIIGFKQWRHTSYAQQAIDMIAAFGDDLKLERLLPRLKKEGSIDAFEALRTLAASDEPVTEDVLLSLLERLTGR